MTGTASLFDSNPSTPLIDGVAHPYWTGVWRKSDPDSRAHDPDFLGWLVSLRNENLLDSALTNALDPDYVIDVVGPGSVPNPQYRVYAEKQDITAPGEASASGRFAYAVLDEGEGQCVPCRSL